MNGAAFRNAERAIRSPWTRKHELRAIALAANDALRTAQRLIEMKDEMINLQRQLSESWERIAKIRERHIKALESAR